MIVILKNKSASEPKKPWYNRFWFLALASLVFAAFPVPAVLLHVALACAAWAVANAWGVITLLAALLEFL